MEEFFVNIFTAEELKSGLTWLWAAVIIRLLLGWSVNVKVERDGE